MAGTAMTVGTVAVVATLAVGLTTAGLASATSARASGAADAAALAAADTASGLVVGVPCARAAEVAERVGASVESCTLSGLVATVQITVPFGAFSARAKARAGPPPGAR
ncbi:MULTISPECIES: Rv3654c family TadE-like protein [unclassified Microbacterium]|uniref:Rv3654c family TadE-like protein n=1 Tax=unclassified Microbacterium TaxID=2609290 RepID=UPI00386E2DD7